ncbi:MAG TPA: hypothetical protein VF292_03105 [Rhodanobacteraceae bacterium]
MPRYLRVTTVFGDRDPDLREWCYRNRRKHTAVIRQALREFLARRGELTAARAGEGAAQSHTSPSAAPKPTPAPVARSAVKPVVAPVPQPIPAAARPANHSRPAERPHDDRSDLRAMLGDFS